MRCKATLLFLGLVWAVTVVTIQTGCAAPPWRVLAQR